MAQLVDAQGYPAGQKTLERKTEAKAREEMNKFLTETNRLRPSPTMSVCAMCEAFIIQCEEEKLAPKTIKGYRDALRLYVKDSIGHIPVNALTPAHVQGMMKGLGAKTAINARAFVRVAINRIARVADHKLGNVAELARPPRYQRGVMRNLTPETYAKVIETETYELARAMWLLLGETGLRPTEARELLWPEIVKREDGYWIALEESKTAEGTKPVPVPDHVAAALLALPRTSLFVFANSKGKPFNETTVCGWWKAAQVAAEVPVTNLYSLRHYFGSVLASKVPDHILKRRMRHTNVKTSKQYYVEAFDAELRASV